MITDDAERIAAFISRRLGAAVAPPFTALGIERDGEVVAGIVFNCFTGFDVQLTIVADRGALSKAFLARCRGYVVDELGCIRATVETESPEAADLALRLGGKVEGVKRDLFGPGRDGTVIGILKSDWSLT